MTRDELIRRLKGYEWTDFECKKARADVPKDAYSTVSAFANTQGGWLLFGVSEQDGELKVSGVDPKAFDRMQDAFLTTLRSGQKLNQIIHAEPQVEEIDGKRILMFHIPEVGRYQKPVYLNGNPRDSYVRRAARDERMTDKALQRFLRDAADRAWDAEPCDFDLETSIELETLDWYREQFYRRNPEQRQITDPNEFLLEWNFAVHESGKPVLTRAAVLLFGTDRSVRALLPRPTLDYQRIDTRFETSSADERWHDRLVFEENLFQTWRGLVAKYSRIAEHPFKLDPSTLRREDDPPDYIAFREAAINLLIHQDYGDHYRKASIKWFTDQTRFWNPGDAFATPAQLLESNEKEIRNPLIVNAFRRIGLSDQAGTGIRAILRNWRELGYRPPQILNDKSAKSFQLVLSQEPLITEFMQRFQADLGVRLSPEQAEVLALAAGQDTLTVVDAAMVIGGNLQKGHEAIRYLTHQQLLTTLDDDTATLAEPARKRLEAQEKAAAEGATGQVAGQVTGQVTGQVIGQVDVWIIEVLSACLDPQKSTDIQQITGIKHRETFQRNYLDRLLNDGLLVRTIPDKPRSRLQAYKTTNKGKALLESQST
jgi:ATP-dependent DNA helicase RecG